MNRRPPAPVHFLLVDDLAENLLALGRLPEATDLAKATMTVLPQDARAARVYLASAGSR